MAAGSIKIKLKSFDHRVIDEAVQKIVDSAMASGAQIIGPIPLPTHRRLITVTTSPHVDKNAREHFEILTHKRVIILDKPTSKTIDSLSHLDLPAGVGIEIKM
ncbi:MAG: 30S ribosomal protein S10 [Patescibacteria group bacterium]